MLIQMSTGTMEKCITQKCDIHVDGRNTMVAKTFYPIYKKGNDIVIHCNGENAKGNFTWKYSSQYTENNRTILFQYPDETALNALLIMDVELTDSGTYVCNNYYEKVLYRIKFEVEITQDPLSEVTSNPLGYEDDGDDDNSAYYLIIILIVLIVVLIVNVVVFACFKMF
jgi:Immunoglobulin domain